MNNGTRKGGAPDTFKVLETSPGLEDLWQLHWSYNVGSNTTRPACSSPTSMTTRRSRGVLTAPPPAPRGAAAGRGAAGRGGGAGGGAAAAHTPAYWLKVSAERDGTFTVTNPRNGFSKTYRPLD